MAARKKTAALPSTIAKIQTTVLVKCLTDHVLGKKEMSSSQVTAALGLIRKVIPDLAAMQVVAQVEHDVVIKWQR